MNDTKPHLNGAFWCDRVGRRFIHLFILPTDHKSRSANNYFVFAQRLKELEVALNLMGRSGNWKQPSRPLKFRIIL